MRVTRTFIAIGFSTAGAVALVTGCRTPPPPRIQVPSTSGGNEYTTYQHDSSKPMPPSATQSAVESPHATVTAPPAPPQPPAVSQAYLDAYDRVGRPRLMVVVERPGQTPRSIVPGDFDTLEKVTRDALTANGQVLVAPAGATAQLTDQQLQSIAAGDAKAIADAGAAVHADVLVEIRVAPSSAEREETQLTAVARNTRDAKQIATATASIPPPPQRRQIDFAGRLLAERLVDELATGWDNLSRIPPAGATQPAPVPATQPERPAGLTG